MELDITCVVTTVQYLSIFKSLVVQLLLQTRIHSIAVVYKSKESSNIVQRKMSLTAWLCCPPVVTIRIAFSTKDFHNDVITGIDLRLLLCNFVIAFRLDLHNLKAEHTHIFLIISRFIFLYCCPFSLSSEQLPHFTSLLWCF